MRALQRSSRSAPAVVRVAVLAVVVALAPVLSVGSGSAAQPAGEASTTTVPTTSTTAPTSTTGTSTSTTAPTSSTQQPLPTLGPLPAIESDPAFQEADGPALGYATQPPFDPFSNTISVANLEDARRRLAEAELATSRGVRLIAKLRFKLAKVESRFERLDEEDQQLVLDAASAYDLFVQRAADAYVRGNDADVLTLLGAHDANEFGTRRTFTESVLEADQSVLDEYLRTREALTGELDALHVAVGTTQRQVKWAKLNEKISRHEAAETTVEVAMWEAGAQVFAADFLFPVRGLAEFGDSWGAPRMTGTSYEHWHEGTDIFSPAGTELVAVEDGVVSRAREGTLGGISLYLVGRSGIEYYYAHLSGYAPGVTAGLVVRRGQVLGYMGNTGNARGGAAHLHFEIHHEGRPVNPYPILAVAYQAQAPLLALVPPPQPPATLPSTSTVPDVATTSPTPTTSPLASTVPAAPTSD